VADSPESDCVLCGLERRLDAECVDGVDFSVLRPLCVFRLYLPCRLFDLAHFHSSSINAIDQSTADRWDYGLGHGLHFSANKRNQLRNGAAVKATTKRK
jgi:hypothetical protein